MTAEIRTYNLDCECEVVTNNPSLQEVAKSALSTLRNPKFPDRSSFNKETLSYVRVEDNGTKTPRVVLTSRPHLENNKNVVDELEINGTEPKRFNYKKRAANPWEVRNEAYRDMLDFHVNGRDGKPGYGRNRTFDQSFTVSVRAPHWLTLGIKGTTRTIEIQHPEGFTHVHPETVKIKESIALEEFQNFLTNNGFSTREEILFYYWESAARRSSSRHDNGWIAIDLKSNKIATWTQNSGAMAVGDISPGVTLVQLPLPIP